MAGGTFLDAPPSQPPPPTITHHHEVQLTADAANRLKDEGDPRHLLAFPILQRRLWGAGDTGTVGTRLQGWHRLPMDAAGAHLKPGTSSVRIMKSLSEAPAAV